MVFSWWISVGKWHYKQYRALTTVKILLFQQSARVVSNGFLLRCVVCVGMCVWYGVERAAPNGFHSTWRARPPTTHKNHPQCHPQHTPVRSLRLWHIERVAAKISKISKNSNISNLEKYPILALTITAIRHAPLLARNIVRPTPVPLNSSPFIRKWIAVHSLSFPLNTKRIATAVAIHSVTRHTSTRQQPWVFPLNLFRQDIHTFIFYFCFFSIACARFLMFFASVQTVGRMLYDLSFHFRFRFK